MKLKAFVKADRSKIKSPNTKWLEIEQNDEKGSKGFFVFYFNDNGEVFADAYGLTLNEAIQIACCSCDVKPEDWKVIDE